MSEEIKESINRIQKIVDFYELNDENNYDYSDEVLISMRNLLDYIKDLQQKVERLNNIINELEKYIKTEAKIELYKDKTGFRTFADSDDILNKLNELKENK